MIGLLMLAALQASAVDAERDFARMAQTEGQWTAFRAFAAPDAVMFLPQPTKAHDFLAGREDPSLTFMWWPAKAYLSCDGNITVTTGPSLRGSYRGYFTTVWQRQADGSWKWVLDHGDALEQPRPATEKVHVQRASCSPQPEVLAPRMVGVDGPKYAKKFGGSPDRSLSWSWRVNKDGSRIVEVALWDGKQFRSVIRDEVAGES